jgi:hypothetical protein
VKRALDAEAGPSGNPARILELVGDEAVATGWERLNGRHDAASLRWGTTPIIAQHLAFVMQEAEPVKYESSKR